MWLFHRFFYEKPQHVKKWISIAVTLVDSNFQLKWTDFLPHFIWPWVKKKPALDLRLPSFMQDLDQFFIIHKMQFVFLCSFLVYIFADLIACKPDARHKQCEKYVKNVFMHSPSPIRVQSRFEFQIGHSITKVCTTLSTDQRYTFIFSYLNRADKNWAHFWKTKNFKNQSFQTISITFISWSPN